MVLTKLVELHRGQPIADFEVGFDHPGPADGRVRIEIEDQPVGTLDVVRARAPRVDFEHVHLHQRQQPLDAVEHRIRLLALALLDHHLAQAVGQALADVLLVKALLALAGGAAHQAERPAGDVRQHPRRRPRRTLGEPALGQALLRIEHAIGMSKPGILQDSGPSAARSPPAFCRRRWSSLRRSSVTVSAGLSSRSPWNEAWRRRPSWVRDRAGPRNQRGSTQISSRFAFAGSAATTAIFRHDASSFRCNSSSVCSLNPPYPAGVDSSLPSCVIAERQRADAPRLVVGLVKPPMTNSSRSSTSPSATPGCAPTGTAISGAWR